MSPPGVLNPTTVSGPVGQRLTIPTHVTPTGGEATHPSIVHIPEGWNGFTHWMAMTPYPGGNNDHEDPNIIASHDGVDWVVPPGLVNPIDDQTGQPAFNSDVDLRMGPNSTLFLFWRTYDPDAAGAEENLYYSTSTDGITWAAKILFYSTDQTLRRLLSPCLLHEQGTWTMWAVDIVDSPNQVVRLTGGILPEDTWSEPASVDVGTMQVGKEPWHLGLAKFEDWYVGLLTDATTDTSGLDGDDLFIAGQDGLTFANSGATVFPRNQPGEHDQLYRATLLTDTDAGVAGYRVWYSAWLLGPPQVWNIYRTFIAPLPAGPPPPVVPPVAVVAIRKEITWYGCDLVSGRIISPIPDIAGDVERILGGYTTASLTVPITPRGPVPLAALLQATAPKWRTMIVAVVNDLPAWAGIVTRRRRGTGPSMALSCSTLEAYFTTRKVRDHTLTGVDEAAIAAVLAGDANTIPGVAGGGIGLVIDAPVTGTLRDRTYETVDRQTVYDRLQELMDVDDGPEWTIDLDWTDSNRTAVAKIFRVRKHIGIEVNALFQTSGAPTISTIGSSDAVYDFDEDSGVDSYANFVVAYSTGQEDDQPASVPAVDTNALNAGAPIVERHFQPSTSISTQTVLDAHAAAELSRLAGGANLFEITARFDAYPRYGVDWQLGDDVQFELHGHGHPDGVQGQARIIGFAVDFNRQLIIPKLLHPTGGI